MVKRATMSAELLAVTPRAERMVEHPTAGMCVVKTGDV